jgi:hypothetical protein
MRCNFIFQQKNIESEKRKLSVIITFLFAQLIAIQSIPQQQFPKNKEKSFQAFLKLTGT